MTGFALRHPVAVAALTLLVLATALSVVSRLPVAFLPDLRIPTLLISTRAPDTTPETIETLITEPLEAVASGVADLKQVTSSSRLGTSLIRLDFTWDADLDTARLELREALDQARASLPEWAERPVIVELDPSRRPIMRIACSTRGDLNRKNIETLTTDVIARRLEQLEGVARARVTGLREPMVAIDLDPDAMSASSIDLDTVIAALQRTSDHLTGGVVRRGDIDIAVEVDGRPGSLDELAATILRATPGTPVRLRDLAEISIDHAPRRGLSRLDGEETLMVLIERRPGANTVTTAAAVRRALDELEVELPGIGLEVVIDDSRTITEAINATLHALLLGALAAMVILALFLRDRRAIIAVTASIPLSLGLTLIAFYLLDITFNLVSLSGIALGIGLLVDNAIVVVDNLARQRATHLEPRQAAAAATREITPPIVASTVTTTLVFLPLAFLDDLGGALFRDLAWAVTSSLASSLLVALTVVPLLAMNTDSNDTGLGRGWHRTYTGGLAWALRRPAVVLVSTLGLVVGATAVAFLLPHGLLPTDHADRMEISLELPPGSSLDRLDAHASTLSRALATHPAVEHVLSDLGTHGNDDLILTPRQPHQGELIVTLRDPVSEHELRAWMAAVLLPDDVRLTTRPPRHGLEPIVNHDGDVMIDFEAFERDRTAPLVGAARQALMDIAGVAEVSGGDDDVGIDAVRLRPASIGPVEVAPDTVFSFLTASTGGREIARFRTLDDDLPIRVRLPSADSIEELLDQNVAGPRPNVPLRSLVVATPLSPPAEHLRVGRVPIERLVATLHDRDNAASVVEEIDTRLHALASPDLWTIRRNTDKLEDILEQASVSFLLSLVLVYLVLCAFYESLILPLVILATVPLALIGAILGLVILDLSIDLISLQGAVVLVGIVVNGGILLIDRIRRGSPTTPFQHRILQAGRDRLRPVVMTTLTTVLAVSPLLLPGVGSELRRPLAVSLTGGLLCGTTLSLFVIPTLCSLLSRLPTFHARPADWNDTDLGSTPADS
ncbi:MAG: efflux RND transporter permease subunit [Acidobacteriota bacterium]